MTTLARLAHREADREVWREVQLGATWAEAETIACAANEVCVRVTSSRGTVSTVVAFRVGEG